MENIWEFEPIPLTQEDINLFHNATFYLYGSKMEPVALAKRSANSNQYRFLSIVRPKYTDEPIHFAFIDIYKPYNGGPYVTKITIMNINSI